MDTHERMYIYPLTAVQLQIPAEEPEPPHSASWPHPEGQGQKGGWEGGRIGLK